MNGKLWSFTAQLLQKLFAKDFFAAWLGSDCFQTLSAQGIGGKNIFQHHGGLKTSLVGSQKDPTGALKRRKLMKGDNPSIAGLWWSPELALGAAEKPVGRPHTLNSLCNDPLSPWHILFQLQLVKCSSVQGCHGKTGIGRTAGRNIGLLVLLTISCVLEALRNDP